MTNITLTVTGAKARAVVNGPLTSGMVGIPVTIKYDDAWNGLTKNLVCRCGKWGPDKGETRTVLGIDTSATIAHEVMQADMYLYLGVEGYSPDGTLVIPTTWADCGKILSGANSDADPSTDPKLSVWGQLQREINQFKTQTVTEEQIAAGVEAYLEENPIEVPEAPNSSALNAAQIAALDNMFMVCAFIKDDVSAEYSAFQAAFGINNSGNEEPDVPVTPTVTLTSISATYSGGDVAVGTAVAALTGIVVTAHYSDGSQQNVTGYTLSGEIVDGENTITVSYGGKTTTFAVNGTAAIEADWTSGTAYDLTGKITTGILLSESNGAESANANKATTDYFNCYGADYIYHYQSSMVIHFYDANKKWIKYRYLNKAPSTVEVPESAVYFRLSGTSSVLTETGEKVIPITKAETNCTLGEQALAWEKGDYDVDGTPITASVIRTGIFPISGATSLTFGENGSLTRVVLYDAHQNFIVRAQSVATPIDLSAEPYVGYSYMAVVAYSEDTITLA